MHRNASKNENGFYGYHVQESCVTTRPEGIVRYIANHTKYRYDENGNYRADTVKKTKSPVKVNQEPPKIKQEPVQNNISLTNKEKTAIYLDWSSRLDSDIQKLCEVNGFNYFVPVSSYCKKQQDNFLIKIKDHHTEKVVGSLRFNYMIPVPEKCLKLLDFKTGIMDENRRIFIEKEYRFCKSKRSAIQKGARKTYERVIGAVSDALVKNSCDFALLEKAHQEYLES